MTERSARSACVDNDWDWRQGPIGPIDLVPYVAGERFRANMAHDFRADRAGYRKIGAQRIRRTAPTSFGAMRTYCTCSNGRIASTSREPCPPSQGWSPFSTGPLSEDGSTSRQIAWAFCSASAQPGSSLRSRFPRQRAGACNAAAQRSVTPSSDRSSPSPIRRCEQQNVLRRTKH